MNGPCGGNGLGSGSAADRGAVLAISTICLLAGLVATPNTVRAADSPGQAKRNVDLILILDTSQTMIGRAGGTNIFPAVKDAARTLVSKCQPGDNVVLITYDSTTTLRPTSIINTSEDKNRIYAEIQRLKAPGRYTYTALALYDALREVQRLDEAQQQSGGGRHTKDVFLLTDGINDPPPGALGDTISLRQAARQVAQMPVFVWQVQLGPKVDQMLADSLGPELGGRIQTIHDPGARDLDRVAENLESTAITPARDSKRIIMTLHPSELAFGPLTPGLPDTLHAVARFMGGQGSGNFRVLAGPGQDGIVLTVLPTEAELGPDSIALSIVLSSKRKLAPGERKGALRVEVSDSLVTPRVADWLWSASVSPAPLKPPGPFPWIPVIAVAALVALVLVLRFGPKPPPRPHGKLTWWVDDNPAGAQGSADFDLFGKRRVRCGNKSDCDHRIEFEEPRAFTVTATRHEDEILCEVNCDEGTELDFAGERVITLLLYDRDQFTVDSFTFEYTGLVQSRPVGDDS